ncbi:galactose-1-phosphate uridylyltransferase [Sulfurimonas sp.]
MSEIRYDLIHNTHVIIAPERLHRPNLSRQKNTQADTKKCPFCEGNEALTPPEIYAMRSNTPNSSGWKTRVVPNLYKAVQIEEENSSKQDGLFETINGFGAHEILIDSPCHDCTMAQLSSEDIENWLRSLVIRKNDLSNDKRLVSLNIFKNAGQNAGASQPHPHTQLIALPIMPDIMLRFLEKNAAYYALHGRGIIEDVVHNEHLAEQRVIQNRGSFLAYAPFASAFAFEVIIAPTTALSDITACSRSELSDLSRLIQQVFKKLQRELGTFDYNIHFHLSPLNVNFENEQYIADLEKNFRFYIRITPRIYTLAGFEIATAVGINSVTPESAAKLLRGEQK